MHVRRFRSPQSTLLGYTYQVTQEPIHGGQECPVGYYEEACAPVGEDDTALGERARRAAGQHSLGKAPNDSRV